LASPTSRWLQTILRMQHATMNFAYVTASDDEGGFDVGGVPSPKYEDASAA